jgi:hypothetical protein
MVFWSQWGEACSLLVRKHLAVLLILFQNPLGFHAPLLLLLLSLNCPLLSKIHLADLGSLFLVILPGDPYFFKFYSFPNKSSFFPINLWIELSKPGIP